MRVSTAAHSMFHLATRPQRVSTTHVQCIMPLLHQLLLAIAAPACNAQFMYLYGIVYEDMSSCAIALSSSSSSSIGNSLY
jgi:hypothetical protein